MHSIEWEDRVYDLHHLVYAVIYWQMHSTVVAMLQDLFRRFISISWVWMLLSKEHVRAKDSSNITMEYKTAF